MKRVRKKKPQPPYAYNSELVYIRPFRKVLGISREKLAKRLSCDWWIFSLYENLELVMPFDLYRKCEQVLINAIYEEGWLMPEERDGLKKLTPPYLPQIVDVVIKRMGPWSVLRWKGYLCHVSPEEVADATNYSPLTIKRMMSRSRCSNQLYEAVYNYLDKCERNFRERMGIR